MKTIFRSRNVIEEMDFQLAGDRPVDYFLLTPEEYKEFVNNGDYTFIEPIEEDEEPYFMYKGVRIVVSK